MHYQNIQTNDTLHSSENNNDGKWNIINSINRYDSKTAEFLVFLASWKIKYNEIVCDALIKQSEAFIRTIYFAKNICNMRIAFVMILKLCPNRSTYITYDINSF